jgi:hypothetical protein
MPEHDEHKGDRQIGCHECYTAEELQAELAIVQAMKVPASPGAKSKPKRSDDPNAPKKGRKSSWMDEMLG